jgi:YD repeat-containing protein
LTSATLPGGASVTYGHDAAGRQVSQTTGGSTTNLLWDEQSAYGDVVLETDGSGAVQASYTLDGQGALLEQTRGSTTSYVLPDGQGSVVAHACDGTSSWSRSGGDTTLLRTRGRGRCSQE